MSRNFEWHTSSLRAVRGLRALCCRWLMCFAFAMTSDALPSQAQAQSSQEKSPHAQFEHKATPVVDSGLAAKMRGVSWREGCPVDLSELRLLTVSHYDYSGQVQEGSIVVHKDVLPDVVSVFQAAFKERFLIARMRPIHEYGGSDDKSVADNNTSAFACRPVTGRKGGFSTHSYGRAIDINPLTNPYLKGKNVIPSAGVSYLDRQQSYPGMIKKSGVVYQAFKSKGWDWGGDWKSLKDYQHFEKSEPSLDGR